MKRIMAMALAMAILLCAGLAHAEGERTLREGKYIIGEDIPAGVYEITCIESTGEKAKDAYGALGSAMDALDGNQSNSYGSLFGAFGGLMEEYIGVTVEILGDYGDVLKSYTMKTGDSFLLKLQEKTALQISDGSYTIAFAQ